MAFYFEDPDAMLRVLDAIYERPAQDRERVVIPPKRSLRGWLSYVYANMRVR